MNRLAKRMQGTNNHVSRERMKNKEQDEQDIYDNGLEAEEPAEEDQQTYAGFTEGQLKALLGKAARVDEVESKLGHRLEKAFGSFGDLNDKVNKLLEASKQEKAETFMPDNVLLELESYDPNLAEVFKKLPAVKREESGDWLRKEDLEKYTATVEEKVNAQVQMGIMSYARPTWGEEQETDEWKAFTSTLPEKDREIVQTTMIASEYLPYFKRFDEWRGKKSRINERLESNVMPRTQRGKQTDDLTNDEMNKWYNYT